MKKLVSLLVAVLCLTTASACVKKSTNPLTTNPLTILVMDSTQALLNNAQVKIGKQTYTTSFDGRIVLQPEQVTAKTLQVSCEGYESKKQDLDGSALILVSLTAKEGRHEKEPRYTLGKAMKGRSEAREAEMVYASAVMADEAMDAMPAYKGPRPIQNDATAGRLTAGEVNDFAKWQLWAHVLDSTHKPFIGTWGLEPRQRYTVQVQTKDGYPVANYPVQLKDTKGNTVFLAITDNTGKAELWNGLIGPRADIIEPQKTIVVDEPCSGNPSSVTGNPSDVDVVFVFDATGSMGDELRYLQAEMKDVIARAKEATGGLSIRTGAVVYRDHSDDYLTRISRLTEDIATTQAFIDKQRASGGGDYPEAVPEALMAALNSAGWNESARARITFLILDAPCHEDSATLALLHEQVLNASAMGVRIVPVVCSGLQESGEYLMRAIALATNGTSFFLTDDSGIGLPHLKPTTDSLKVEHLNDMLVRTIVQFSKMPECQPFDETEELTDNEFFLPNPFTTADLEADPTIPNGEGVHYLIDISGKLLGVYKGDIDQLPITNHQLPIGIYFIKTYYEGIWHTKKILVR